MHEKHFSSFPRTTLVKETREGAFFYHGQKEKSSWHDSVVSGYPIFHGLAKQGDECNAYFGNQRDSRWNEHTQF